MIVSIIPARGGSKGIPRKNLVELDGHPLIYYSIVPSLRSVVDRTIVSTDDPEIRSVAEELGAEVIVRPDILSGDGVPTEPVVEHIITSLDLHEDDTVVLLQPTQPVRCAELINRSLDTFAEVNDKDAVFTAHEEKYYHWSKWKTRPGITAGDGWGWSGVGFDFAGVRRPRQGESVQVRENGNVYVTSPNSYINHNRFGTNPQPYLTHPICGMELDDPWQVTILSSVLESIRKGEIEWESLILEEG